MMERLTGEQIQLDFQPGENLPAIHADDSMIEQVVMNLSVNARDAMPAGGKIHVTTALVTVHRAANPLDPQNRHGEFVCLTFTDTGCGMNTEILGRIFEPFFTTKSPGKGTGLGLATVLSIVRQHEGWLEVESQPNQGTTFKLYFQTSQQPAVKQSTIDEGELKSGRETILVAEDEDPLREMIAELLEYQGYKVLTARSGRHALEVWQASNQEIDLLVTDMIMPEGILGIELAELLLIQKPGLKVIFTSGYSPDMAGKNISLVEGINFMPKPYSIGKMAQLVRQCLDNSVNMSV
jgi:CheY-like chemotaxis protein